MALVQVGCADGATRLFYNPKKSKNGVMISNARAPKKCAPRCWWGAGMWLHHCSLRVYRGGHRRTMSDYVRPSTIHNPNALPMYQKDPTYVARIEVCQLRTC